MTENKKITVAFLGDSVTAGCFELYPSGNTFGIEYDTRSVYHSLLKKKYDTLRGSLPELDIINAGISGDGAAGGLARVEKDICESPAEICVVNYGLNDVLDHSDINRDYRDNMIGIYSKIKQSGKKVICLTPNMLNTYVAEGTLACLTETAKHTAYMQNVGDMDSLVLNIKYAAMDMGIQICDCYRAWKEMYASGTDTTMLLCNRINHPTREMHNLFADKLLPILLNECFIGTKYEEEYRKNFR